MEKDAQFLDDLKRVIAPVDLEKSGFYSSDSGKEFHVVDEPQPAHIVASASLSLQVKNPKHSRIHLISMDKGLVTLLAKPKYIGKCPEGILLNNQDLCFIELKLNVISSSAITQTDRIEDAIAQFADLISDLKARFLNISKNFMALGFKYEAYIVLPSNKYPRSSSMSKNRRASFLMKHKIELFETNIKEFD